MPLAIGIAAEGHTDQVVIERILQGCLPDDEPDVTYVQPQDTAPDANGTYAPGGWTVLFRWLREGGHRAALQTLDRLVIHVDTDVCEETGFGVRRDGREVPELVAAVVQRLGTEMGEGFVAEHGHRVVFAVAVDSTECWLLPLLTDKKADAGKTAGCLVRVNRLLKQKNEARISHNDGSGKDAARYVEVSRPFRKPKVLMEAANRNPSLGILVSEIQSKA